MIDISPKPKPERTVKRIIDGAGCITAYLEPYLPSQEALWH